MPEGRSAYTRGHSQTSARGHQPTVFCSYCGRKVPRHKCFIQYSGFHITDPVLRKEISRNQVSAGTNKMYACPACARHRGIIMKRDQTGRMVSVKKKSGKRL
ncbi:MAG: hypothetical protein GQ477_01070 [Nanohaloarchaea archaeon]|nr:hypothetical protein [Candidatus Nanohaloarchaea archaeon]